MSRAAKGSVGVDRRSFLQAVGAVSLLGVAGGCATMPSVRTPVRIGRVRLRLAEHPELTRPGGSLALRVDGTPAPLYVLATEEPEPTVLSSVCTHLGCVVDVEGRHLVCPCHGSTYDREGRVLGGPATRPLTRLPARVVDGVLEIDVEGVR